MKATTGISLLIIFFIFAVILASNPSNSQEEVQDPFPEVLAKLTYLNSMGVNVTSLVDDLNEALMLYQKGNISQAMSILNEVNATASSLLSRADETHFRQLFEKYTEAALLLSIPLIIYVALPRAYAYFWYNSRKNWRVKKK
jgi:hypothetical protein|uniref:Uncharacterized protein n=1 Tax=Fervidicoccus fontis TaxID=683846 RepID=A0A7J3SL12_9CREN